MCDLVEDRKTKSIGILGILDDVCATLHSQARARIVLKMMMMTLRMMLCDNVIVVVGDEVFVVVMTLILMNVMQGDGADIKLLGKLSEGVGTHEHFKAFNGGFTIKHYAGEVSAPRIHSSK